MGVARTFGPVEKPRHRNEASVSKGIASAQRAAPRNDGPYKVIARSGVRRRRTERRSNPPQRHRIPIAEIGTFSTRPFVRVSLRGHGPLCCMKPGPRSGPPDRWEAQSFASSMACVSLRMPSKLSCWEGEPPGEPQRRGRTRLRP
jgi:hypothetical protein